MKKCSALLVLLTVISALCCLHLSAADTIGAEIAAKNVVFGQSVYLSYAVSYENAPADAEKGLLLWKSGAPVYPAYGYEEFKVTDVTMRDTVSGKVCDILDFTELYADEMTKDVYAVPFVKSGEDVTYGELTKYSVLRYAYNKLGYTGTASSDQRLKNLISSMLAYGADVQTYLGVDTDRLPTDRYVLITVENGVLPDGTEEGLYKPASKLTLTAKMPEGETFDHWEDVGGNNIGTEPTLTVTADSVNSVYTAVMQSMTPPVPAESLVFTSNGDGTCTVTGIGTVTGSNITIPQLSPAGETVTKIGVKAFENCTAATTITIPNTVTEIGNRAFFGCTGITEITIPESVTVIGTQVFYKAENLKTVYYNAKCSEWAFNESTAPFIGTNIEKMVIGTEGAVSMHLCRNLSKLKTVIILDSVTGIGGSMFKGCTSLTSINIPNYVTRIYDDAFSGCISLTSVTIPDRVTSIGNNVFQNCSSLTSVTIPNSVTSIGVAAFYGCISMTSVTIPDNVTNIGDYAFSGCSSLISITIPDSVTNIGRNAFSGCTSLTSVTIPDSVTSIGSSTFSGCTSLTTATIPSSVTSIGSSAFSGCTSLNAVTIPNSVTSIDVNTFYGCISLTSITISDNLTNIGDYAFSGCLSLISITIPDSVTNIGREAFSSCTSLTSVIIPDSVTSTSDGVFANCTSLTSVTIPDSMTSIGEWAFYNCISLTNICYSGTTAQWSAISKASSWNSYTSSYIIHCTDGDIPKT